MTKYFNIINNYKFDDKTIFMKAVPSIILADGYYWNSQHVYWDFTIALDQLESKTQLCHARAVLYLSTKKYCEACMNKKIEVHKANHGCKIIYTVPVKPNTGC